MSATLSTSELECSHSRSRFGLGLSAPPWAERGKPGDCRFGQWPVLVAGAAGAGVAATAVAPAPPAGRVCVVGAGKNQLLCCACGKSRFLVVRSRGVEQLATLQLVHSLEPSPRRLDAVQPLG